MSPARLIPCILLLALAGGGLAAPHDVLAPRLSRRIAVEDEPVVLEVTLPDGMPITGRQGGEVVGGPGVDYTYSWFLTDSEGTTLRRRQVRHARPRDRWETAAIIEPYSARYTEKLQVRIEVEYHGSGGAVLHRARSRYSLPRVQDVTPPLRRSGGDEEGYPDFEATSLSARDGAMVTTTDRFPGSQPLQGRSPFQAIIDDGQVLEGDPASPETLGALEFAWANVFDNQGPPFAGEGVHPVARFGLYLIPRWDLTGSHHLVTDAGSPHMKTDRLVVREDGEGLELHLVDLTDQLGDPPTAPGPVGRGKVRIPLPYDRVGEMEVGFYAEDAAWPSPNHVRAGSFRFRVVDDIAPVVVLSLQKPSGAERTWISADAVNLRWTSGEAPYSLPPRFSGPPMRRLSPLALKVQTAYPLQAMVFDNTRLARDGLRIEVHGPPDADGYGIRPGKTGRVTRWTVPVDGFDPSLARTPRSPVPQLYFSVPGRYRLVLVAADVHGERRKFEVELDVGEREVDWLRVGQERIRLGRDRGRP
jgi:hypothetical protein